MCHPSARLLLAVTLFSIPVGLSAQGVHEAVAAGDEEGVLALLEGGADPNTTTERGTTPLGAAILKGSPELVELLLEWGADPNGGGGRGLSAVDLAFVRDCQTDSELVGILMDGGGRLEPGAPWPYPVSRLNLAATFGQAGLARLLLELGADPDLQERGGRTALHLATRSGYPELAETLLDFGADPNLTDDEGNTPLSRSVSKGHAQVVGLLLDHGAALDYLKPGLNQTLVHLAVLGGHLDVAAALVDRGVPVDARDSRGHTALHYAGQYGHERVARYLLERGGDESDLASRRFGPAPYLEEGIGEGEAALWYLNNRGWAVKSSDHLLVFDAEEFGVTRPTEPSLANGFLTSGEIGSQDVAAFYSCYHGEPGEPAYIHEIEDSLQSVIYVQNAGDRWRGSDRSVYLSPRESTALPDGKVTVVGTMTQMATLGHLVEMDGLVVYYQGFEPDDMEYYRGELGFLETVTDHIDIAFLPIPELGEGAEESAFRMFLDRFQPRAIALLDPGRRENLYPEVAELVRSWGFESEVYAAANPGDVFLFR